MPTVCTLYPRFQPGPGHRNSAPISAPTAAPPSTPILPPAMAWLTRCSPMMPPPSPAVRGNGVPCTTARHAHLEAVRVQSAAVLTQDHLMWPAVK